MADVTRFRLKQTPTDVWSIRERLALASSVSRSGDQNWVSVSRAVRPFGMPNRPPDWFSQKNCALQYSELLENVETPRRKRNEREAVETPGDVIVRKLTIERIEELKKLIAKEAEEYRALKKDLETARLGAYDGQIKEMWEKLQADKAAAALTAAKAAAEELAARERAKAAALKLKKSSLPLSIKSLPSSDFEDSTQDSSAFDPFNNEDSNLSLVSSVPTPCLSQNTEMSLSIASPAANVFLSQSPKTEVLPSVDTSIAKDEDLIAATPMTDSDETTDVKKVEIKQEELVVEESEKVEIDVVSDVTVKIEEQVVDEPSEDVVTNAVDEVEIKTDSPAPGAESVLLEKENVTDDELIPFTPDEEITSPFLIPAETTAQDPSIENSSMQEVQVEVTKDSPEEVVEETLVSEVEEKPQEEEEVEENKEEKETEEKKTEEIHEIHNVLQDEVVVAEAEQPTPVEEEVEAAPKSVEVTAPVAEPVSPTSSIISTETGSVHSKKSNRRGRGRKPKRGRRPANRARQQSEEGKESELSSKEGETSDEEGSRVQPPENEDSMLLSSLPQHIDPNESLPNSPASLSHSDTEDEKSHRVWKKSIMLVWRAATNHKCASVFLHPVTEDIAPGYHSIVHKPMDLQKIKRKIDNGEIRTTAEFQRDMMLMFTNAIMYNNSDHDVHKMAKNMYKDVMGHIEQFVSTQIMVRAEPKLLRTLRRTDAVAAHSDREEETKRKRPVENEQTPSTSGAKVKKRKL